MSIGDAHDACTAASMTILACDETSLYQWSKLMAPMGMNIPFWLHHVGRALADDVHTLLFDSRL